MRNKLQRVWPILKLSLWLLILFFIGRQFARDLPNAKLGQRSLHAGWLLLSGLLYILGLGLSAFYWRRLLGHLGARPPLSAVLRAYYIGHLGKYLPGKGWSLFLRTSLAHGHGVRIGLAVLTSFYEVLIGMAAGVLVAAALFATLGVGDGNGMAPACAEWDGETWRQLLKMELPGEGGIPRSAVVLLSVLLFGAFLVPLHPAIFNWLASRSRSTVPASVGQLPPIRLVYLLEGLAFAAVAWLFLGVSFAATLRGIDGTDWPLLDRRTARLPAIVGLSNVIGFVVFIAPGGIGVREFMLILLLMPELVSTRGMGSQEARATVVLAVLVLRLVWTAAELIMALACWVYPFVPGVLTKINIYCKQ